MGILTEDFAADTGQFAQFNTGGSFAVVAPQGIFTCPGDGSLHGISVQEIPWQPTSASLFVSAVLGTPTWQWPFPGGFQNIGTGILKDANNYLVIEISSQSSSTAILFDLLFIFAGTQHNLASGSFSTSQLPDKIGFGLNGNIATAWLSFGGTWQAIPATSIDVSGINDFTAPGALTGWLAGTHMDMQGVTTHTSIALSQMQYVTPFAPPTTLIDVPDVTTETQTQAEIDLTAANLTVGAITSGFSATITAGSVISQNPVAGAMVSVGTPVDLVISDGPPPEGTVPDLTNTSITVVAPELLAAVGLIFGTITYAPSGTIIAGNIISQTPAPGTGAPLGTAVNVVVSSGSPPLTVPDLFGLTQTDAINLLLSLGLVPGAIGSAPSKFVPPGEVQAQNPNAGIAVAVGTIVSFVLSQGTPVAGTLFDFEATVISQYANSPTILQLCNNLNQYIDQSANFANFFNFVWNVDTAVGFGLDIWGKIVGVSRLLQIPNTTKYVGFYQPSESQPAQDWTPAGSDQPPYNNPPVGGAFYTGDNATTAYLLPDDSYRQLILAKAFANIASTTAPAINQILQNLYGPGSAWVLNTGPMAISYNLSFTPTAIQLAILEQSGVIPTPPGVSVVINTNV